MHWRVRSVMALRLSEQRTFLLKRRDQGFVNGTSQRWLDGRVRLVSRNAPVVGGKNRE